jgi:hypothetical protein
MLEEFRTLGFELINVFLHVAYVFLSSVLFLISLSQAKGNQSVQKFFLRHERPSVTPSGNFDDSVSFTSKVEDPCLENLWKASKLPR